MSVHKEARRITTHTLREMKRQGEKIAALTCYDASFTRLIESAGMDVILVGDSLGMVIQGHESTLPVTVADMVYHTANVMRVSEHCMVIADMPFMSYQSSLEKAVENAGRFLKEAGCDAIKLEGGVRIPMIWSWIS